MPQPTLGMPAQPLLGVPGAPSAPLTPTPAHDGTAGVNVVPLHPPFGFGSIVGLIAAAGIIAGGFLDWWPRASARRLPMLWLFDFHGTTSNPKVGDIVIAIGVLGALACVVPFMRMWRFPLGLAAIALPFLYLTPFDRLLHAAHSHQSVTDFAKTGVWVTLVSGFVLAASVRMHKKSLQSGRTFALIASALVVALMTHAIFGNGTSKMQLPSQIGIASAGASASQSAAASPNACDLVSAGDASQMMGAAAVKAPSSRPLTSWCLWDAGKRSRYGESADQLGVFVANGTARTLDTSYAHAEALKGVGDAARLLPQSTSHEHSLTLVFVRNGVLVSLQYVVQGTHAGAREPELIALARSVVARL
jgi:hypothetical protein